MNINLKLSKFNSMWMDHTNESSKGVKKETFKNNGKNKKQSSKRIRDKKIIRNLKIKKSKIKNQSQKESKNKFETV